MTSAGITLRTAFFKLSDNPAMIEGWKNANQQQGWNQRSSSLCPATLVQLLKRLEVSRTNIIPVPTAGFPPNTREGWPHNKPGKWWGCTLSQFVCKLQRNHLEVAFQGIEDSRTPSRDCRYDNWDELRRKHIHRKWIALEPVPLFAASLMSSLDDVGKPNYQRKLHHFVNCTCTNNLIIAHRLKKHQTFPSSQSLL